MSELIMAEGDIKLKGLELLGKSGLTLYAVARDGQLNYSTILRWMNEPDKIQSFDVLLGFLRGLGMDSEEIRDMRLGDLFYIDEGGGQ